VVIMTKLYEQIGIETEVLSASPHRLIQMLLDRAIQQIKLSTIYMQQNDIAKKCHAISRSMDIVCYLRLILEKENPQTKELSEKLSLVYEFVEKQLLKANITNDAKPLDDALNNLVQIKSGWDGIGEKHGR